MLRQKKRPKFLQRKALLKRSSVLVCASRPVAAVTDRLTIRHTMVLQERSTSSALKWILQNRKNWQKLSLSLLTLRSPANMMSLLLLVSLLLSR